MVVAAEGSRNLPNLVPVLANAQEGNSITKRIQRLVNDLLLFGG
jgi:hypothetical protein